VTLRNFPPSPALSAGVRARRIVALLLLGLVLACPAAASARRTVPRGWMGAVVTDASLLDSDELFASEAKSMQAAGVESIRVPFYWSGAQRHRRQSSVPASARDHYVMGRNGIPTDFRRTDRVVGEASLRKLRVLPIVLGAPRWASGGNSGRAISQPRGTKDYVNYLLTLADRYGPGGSFWNEREDLPYRPIRAWQIWNEPDHPNFWHRAHGRWPAEYVRLLRASRAALKAHDHGAKIVLGALTGFSWTNLPRLYKVGLKGQFDELALNPYTKHVANTVRTVELCRAAMRRAGDRVRPVALTELSWPASRGRVPRRRQVSFSVTDHQQGARLTAAMKLLAHERRRLNIVEVDWFTWVSTYRGDNPWDYAGLRRISRSGVVTAKPSLAAFTRIARRLEGR
jgi:hypothetical protein